MTNASSSAIAVPYLEGDLPFVLSSTSVRILKILSQLRAGSTSAAVRCAFTSLQPPAAARADC